jgi:hypothetical protein
MESLPSYPTLALTVSARRIRPGDKLTGELLLRGGAEPVVIDQVRARLWARVYALFDDDDGAPAVRLYDEAIAKQIQLGVREELAVNVRLPVAWSTPVTLVNGRGLSGLSVLLMLWCEAAASTGDVILHLQVEPLPWQHDVLETIQQRGLSWDTTYAYKGSQHFTHYRTDQTPEVSLSWRVQRRRVSIGLNGRELRLTHDEATQGDWRDPLSSWLDALLSRPRKRR